MTQVTEEEELQIDALIENMEEDNQVHSEQKKKSTTPIKKKSKQKLWCIRHPGPLPGQIGGPRLVPKGFWVGPPPIGLMLIWMDKEDEMEDHQRKELERYKQCRKFEKEYSDSRPDLFCTKCYQIGHRINKCKNKKVCSICRKEDHNQYSCKYRLCYNCGHYGHWKKQCTKAWNIYPEKRKAFFGN